MSSLEQTLEPDATSADLSPPKVHMPSEPPAPRPAAPRPAAPRHGEAGTPLCVIARMPLYLPISLTLTLTYWHHPTYSPTP